MEIGTVAAFLVRFAGQYYFVERDRLGDARGSYIASFARTMTYDTAHIVALRLREMGHVDAVVTDICGRIVTPEDIATIGDPAQSEEFQKAWPVSEPVAGDK